MSVDLHWLNNMAFFESSADQCFGEGNEDESNNPQRLNPDNSPDSMSRKRLNSLNIPPSFSLVLVGHDWMEINEVCNFLLRRQLKTRNPANPGKNPMTFMTFTGYMHDGNLSLDKTAELYSSDISDQDLNQRVKECVSFCASGPHAVGLVVNPQGFGRKKKQGLQKIVRSFSSQGFHQCIILIYKDPNFISNRTFRNCIAICGNKLNDCRKTEALKDVEKMISGNNWSHITCCGIPEMDTGSKTLNLVLCGNSEAAKAFTADLILGVPTAPSSGFVKKEAEVFGYHVTLVLLPALESTHFSEGREAVMQHILHALHVCEPGIHAFLVVLPHGQHRTNLDEEEWLQIIHIGASDFRLILHSTGFQHQIVDIDPSRTSQDETERFTETGHRDVSYLGSSLNAKTLLDDVYEMNSFYTIKMFYTAWDGQLTQLKKNLQQLQTQIMLKSSREGVESSNKLNLVLCGSCETAKASAADLILGEQTEPSTQPSSECVKREGNVCGHHVTLVLFPALGKTQLPEEEVLLRTRNCLCLCDNTVHAFVQVIAQGLLTDEDKGEWARIKSLFGDKVDDNHQKVQMKQSQEGTMGEDEIFEGAFYILDDSSKISPLLRKIVNNTTGCYTSEMYITEQLKSLLQCNRQLENMKIKIQELQIENNTLKGSYQDTTGELRIVLLGKTGCGKSASGNTILGNVVFNEDTSSESVTAACQKGTTIIGGRQITVIDTPGLFDTACDDEETRREILRCVAMAAPGPHVFLLVLTIGARFTTEEKNAVKIIKELFGEESERYTLVLFTRGDDLKNTFESYLEKSKAGLKALLNQCGNRHHVFSNRARNKDQVQKLLCKIDAMLRVNGGSYYTTEMFQRVEETLKHDQERILKEREEEIKNKIEEIQAKYDASIGTLTREMEEQRGIQEEERRRREEEFKNKVQDMIKAKKAFEEEEIRKRSEMEETYREQKKRNEEWIKKQTEEIQQERQRHQEDWDRKTQEDRMRREEEEKQREIKEMEFQQQWCEKHNQEREKFNHEIEAIKRAAEEEKRKKELEYKESVKEEEEKRKDLEEKIKHAEVNRIEDLKEQKRQYDEECERRSEKEAKMRDEQENKWKKQIESMEQAWVAQQEHQTQEKEKYERKQQQERQERDAEEKQKRIEQDKERQKIEDAERKIKEKEVEMRKLQEDYDAKLQQEERKSAHQKEDMEMQLRLQREQFDKQKEADAKASEERERMNMKYLKEMHEKEKALLRTETELDARKQAEDEFNEKLNKCVKRFSRRTRPGMVVDTFVNMYLPDFR